MPKGVAHSQETRETVIGMYLSGAFTDEIIKKTGLPGRTVRLWIEKSEEAQAFRAGKMERIEREILTFVKDGFANLNKAAGYLLEKSYLQKQPGSEAGVLFGIVSDKIIKIASVIPTHDTNEGEETEGTT